MAGVFLVLCAIAARREHLHIFCPHFSEIAGNTLLIHIVSGAQRTFDIEFVTLVDILLHNFGQPSPHDNVVPFGTFGHLRAVGQGIARRGGGQGEGGGGHALVEIAYHGVFAHVTYEHYFVEGHSEALF